MSNGNQNSPLVRDRISYAPDGILFMPFDQELELQRQYQREMYWHFAKKVAWFRLLRDQAIGWNFPTLYWNDQQLVWDQDRNVDELYTERRHQPFGAPVWVPAFVELNPNRQMLLKVGIDEQRDLVIHLSTVILDDLKISLDVRVGDKFLFDNLEYMVQNVWFDKYWANTNVPLEQVCALQRYRQGE